MSDEEDTIEVPTEMLEELRHAAALVERGLASFEEEYKPGISFRYFLWCVYCGITEVWEYIKESKNVFFLIWPKTYLIFWREYKEEIEDKKKWDRMTPVQRNYNREELRKLTLQVKEIIETYLPDADADESGKPADSRQ